MRSALAVDHNIEVGLKLKKISNYFRFRLNLLRLSALHNKFKLNVYKAPMAGAAGLPLTRLKVDGREQN